MPFFQPQSGLSLAYDDIGEGPPIVLVHGFASNRKTNWVGPGWYDALAMVGRRVIALDLRGHGMSDKLYDPLDYDEGLMARDVLALLDHLRITRADFMGYSMGGFIGVSAAAQAPDRWGRIVLSGIGKNYVGSSVVDPQEIADGLRASALADVTGAVARQFRRFAEASGNDLNALAACMLRPRRSLQAFELTQVQNLVLVIAGERDAISGPPEALASLFPRGESALIPGRDHMTAVGDKAHKVAVLQFLI